MRNKQSIVLVGVLALLVLATSCSKLKARDQLNKGVTAFSNAQYPEAVEFFKEAVALDPDFPTARLYLATAYMSQYIPGAESEDNLAMAKMAEDEFQRVLDSNPEDQTTVTTAIASIASLHFHKKEFDVAEEWNQKLIAVDPTKKEAYYTLGVIAWTRAFQRTAEARAELQMPPEAPGPLNKEEVRIAVRDSTLPIINSGLEMLEKALEVDPEYDDAMAYLNLLHRQKAEVADSKEEYEAEIASAEDWVDKTLATKKLKAARNQQASFGLEGE